MASLYSSSFTPTPSGCTSSWTSRRTHALQMRCLPEESSVSSLMAEVRSFHHQFGEVEQRDPGENHQRNSDASFPGVYLRNQVRCGDIEGDPSRQRQDVR